MNNYRKNLLIVMYSIVALILLYAICTYFHVVGFYNGINKGTYIFNCGYEWVGNPGFFCGNY